jgi:Helix-turn-helix of DDE superfamily endonuclease
MEGAQEMVRYAREKDKANRIMQLTSLTVEQFEGLVEPFEQAFVKHMSEWTMEGKPRTGRAYSQYTNCPLPTPEDRLLFLLSYMKVASIQEAHGALFGMTQSNANKWIHLLLLVMQQTLTNLGDAPARHLEALRQRLAELELQEGDIPLFTTMAPSGQLSVPKTQMSRKRIIAARKNAIP